MNWIKLIWRFSRPHTIIGTVASVGALFIIANNSLSSALSFCISLCAALFTNLFITGFNQLVDIDLDKIAKPNLPLPSGDLKVKDGKRIVVLSLMLSFLCAAMLGFQFFIFISSICLIGFLYSWKKTYFKKHHLSAAAAIFIVRGVLVNLGFYTFFLNGNFNSFDPPLFIWVLTVFVILFSLGIAWFKDIPDRKADDTRDIKSLSIVFGVKGAYRLGVLSVLSGYLLVSLFTIYSKDDSLNEPFLLLANTAAGFLFAGISFLIDPFNLKSIRVFYKLFWVLFVLEYILFAIAAVI